jgi:hypothetical protein
MSVKVSLIRRPSILPQLQLNPTMIDLTPKLEVSTCSFIIIKHGDNKQDIFNINCKVSLTQRLRSQFSSLISRFYCLFNFCL